MLAGFLQSVFYERRMCLFCCSRSVGKTSRLLDLTDVELIHPVLKSAESPMICDYLSRI